MVIGGLQVAGVAGTYQLSFVDGYFIDASTEGLSMTDAAAFEITVPGH